MLKVLHGADFHLDSPFSGLKPDAAARRRGEQRELLARLTDLAREREADLVLLSGDLLDGDLVFRETLQALHQVLEEMEAPVFLAPGNHDWYGPQSLYAALEWPGNVHLFTGPELGAVRLPELGCTVWGAAFCAPRQSASPLRGFHAPAEGVQLDHHPDPHKSRAQYLPLLELSVAEAPEDDRNTHYLGREYLFYGRWDDCIRTLERHLSLPTAVWADERCASMRFLARAAEGPAGAGPAVAVAGHRGGPSPAGALPGAGAPTL